VSANVLPSARFADAVDITVDRQGNSTAAVGVWILTIDGKSAV